MRMRPPSLPLPETDDEFAIVTDAWFGMPLHVGVLSISTQFGRYEIAEDYDVFGTPHDYDKSQRLWDRVFGPLDCGGVARTSYGSFKLGGHRHVRRLDRWVKNRATGVSYTRKPFKRLAVAIRAQREQSDSR
jgi:hypothetical protein